MNGAQHDSLMHDFAERLLKITEGCRTDMAVPEELTAAVTGAEFDNSCGDDPSSGQMVVSLKREYGKNSLAAGERFNLATLIAFARLGARFAIEANKLIEVA